MCLQRPNYVVSPLKIHGNMRSNNTGMNFLKLHRLHKPANIYLINIEKCIVAAESRTSLPSVAVVA